MQKRLLFSAMLPAILPPASAAPQKPLSRVKKVYEASSKGNIFFNRQMRKQIQNAGFEWTNKREDADALVSTRGDWMKGGGFAGEVEFKSPSGRILWEKRVERKEGETKMAFERLGEELRNAK